MGNKFFQAKRYELAIDCYTRAMAVCPKERAAEQAIFYQNRAAAHEQLVRQIDLNQYTKLT
jgi:import receptor subunit TOM70